MGMYLMSVHLIGVYLMGVHLTGVYLIGTYGRASTRAAVDNFTN